MTKAQIQAARLNIERQQRELCAEYGICIIGYSPPQRSQPRQQTGHNRTLTKQKNHGIMHTIARFVRKWRL